MISIRVVVRASVLAASLAGLPFPAGADELTLAEAERLALDTAPWLKHHRAAVTAAGERAVYEGRLPDPQLTLGAVNVPTDSWRLNQEDMTMVMIGLRQRFPPGQTLRLREQRAREEQSRERAKSELEQRQLLRQVRLAWFELYYQEAALRQIAEARRLQQKQIEAAEGRFRAAQEPPQTVFRARAALARLAERAAMIEAQRARARAQLAHWLGEAAWRDLPTTLPTLPAAREFHLDQHPDVAAAQAMAAMARTETALMRQENRPGWMLDVNVGVRQNTPTGQPRSNMVTAMVTFDLPLFRGNRQDRRVAEKQALAEGAEHETEDRRRELVMMDRGLRAEHAALRARAAIFENELLPALRRETQVTATGFARDQADARDARMRLIDAELDYLRLQVDIARTHTEILFLTGEPQS
jgi:outer membrane protein TolC